MSLEGTPSPSAEVPFEKSEKSGQGSMAATVRTDRERAGPDEVDGTGQRNLPPVRSEV